MGAAGGLVRSQARVVGRIALPDGLGWGEAIASPRLRAQALLDFQALCVRAFGLKPARVRVHHQLWIGPTLGREEPAQIWHFDACSPYGHILCSLGGPPTEFLLGEFPESYCREKADLAPLEGRLERWVPRSGEAVHVDRRTIHRRPACGLEPRLLLVGSKAPDPGEEDPYEAQRRAMGR